MRIDIHDRRGKSRLRIVVDPANPPGVVRLPGPESAAVALDWNQATDDRGVLRRCPVCGYAGLYVRRSIPQITWFAAVVALGLAALLFTYGHELSSAALIALAVLLVGDLLIWRFAPRMIACYRCEAHFRQTPIPPGLGPWDPAQAVPAPAERGPHAGAAR